MFPLWQPIWLLFKYCNFLPDLYYKKWGIRNELSDVLRELNFDISYQINSTKMIMIFFHIYKKWNHIYLEVTWVSASTLAHVFTFQIALTICTIWGKQVFKRNSSSWLKICVESTDWLVSHRLKIPLAKVKKAGFSMNWFSY
jgi:hypothetical protein